MMKPLNTLNYIERECLTKTKINTENIKESISMNGIKQIPTKEKKLLRKVMQSTQNIGDNGKSRINIKCVNMQNKAIKKIETKSSKDEKKRDITMNREKYGENLINQKNIIIDANGEKSIPTIKKNGTKKIQKKLVQSKKKSELNTNCNTKLEQSLIFSFQRRHFVDYAVMSLNQKSYNGITGFIESLQKEEMLPVYAKTVTPYCIYHIMEVRK